MCGLAGIYAYRADRIDPDELLAIRDHMAARGPDGSGLWPPRPESGQVGLAHRRLSIIDLSEAGAQPMHDEHGRTSIVFNGEIYNHEELRRQLQAQGDTFQSTSDTEVLLKLYARHGAAMLRRLRGMYALAIWDHARGELFLARDPFGIKPLYYADDGRSFRFASQVKALLRGRVDTTPDAAGHVGFFVWGSVPEPHTLYRGVRSLPAGHWMRVSAAGAQQPTPFDSPQDVLAQACTDGTALSDEQALQTVADAIRDSVRAHLVADVPVGVFLSSGLDSAMLACSAAGTGAGLRSVTLGFDEFAGTPIDEAPLAAQIAQTARIRHTCMRVRRSDFQDDRERLLQAMDQPTIDGVNTWFVAKAAAMQGFKVALSGLGGDEVFGSYPSFSEVPRMATALARFAAYPKLGRNFRRLTAPLLERITSPKYAGLLEYGGSLGGAYLLRRGLFMPWELKDFLDPDMVAEGWRTLQTEQSLAALTAGVPSEHHAVSSLEMSCYMRNQLLRDADWAGMAHSVEIRVPLVDMELLRVVSPILARRRMAKRVVAARVASQLPASVLDRPKTGFAVPVRDWQAQEDTGRERGLRSWAKHVYRAHGGLAR